jgi:uncharacterized membrane protein
MPKQNTKMKKEDEKKLFAFIASFFTIIGFIIAFVLRKEDKYIMYYAKHGLILFIGQIFVWFFSIFSFLRFVYWILMVFWLILWVLTWLNALSGKEKETIIITELAEKLDL